MHGIKKFTLLKRQKLIMFSTLVPIRAGNWNNTFQAGTGYLNLNNVRTNSNNNVGVRDLEESFCLRALPDLVRMYSFKGFLSVIEKSEIKKDSNFCGSLKAKLKLITKTRRY